MSSSRHEQPNISAVEDLSDTEKLVGLDIRDHRYEHPGTYMVQDLSSKGELNRLALQDQMLTTGMGGVLPEQGDPTGLHRVLDAGCGTGGWLLETAKVVPTISLLIGIDFRKMIINYARAQAAANQLGDRVRFYVMDALQMSQFPSAFFDLVNQRLGMSYLRTWEWAKLLAEYQRITRPGGIIRITECSGPESNSEALTQLHTLLIRALSQAGHLFVPDDPDGVIDKLVPLFKEQRLGNIQTRLHTLVFRAGTPEGQLFMEDQKYLFKTLLPFLKKWSHVPDNYREICRQAVYDMQQSEFVATWKLLTVWGINPAR